MAAIIYGVVTCNGSPANGATVEFDGPPDSNTTADSNGVYSKSMDAGSYEITASCSGCTDGTEPRKNYDDGFHNVDFALT